MSSANARFQRILALQRQIQRIDAMRLVSLNIAVRNFKSQEAKLIERLGADEGLTSSLPDALLEALKSATRRRCEIVAQIAVQAAAAREHSRKTRQAERIAANARLKSERETAERHLRETIDWAIGPEKVSSP